MKCKQINKQSNKWDKFGIIRTLPNQIITRFREQDFDTRKWNFGNKNC